MKKTKIVCSVGPSSSNYNTIKSMIKNGMNVVRINFSHAKEKETKELARTIKAINEELNVSIGVMYDTKGPDFRGTIDEDELILKTGREVLLSKIDLIDERDTIIVNCEELIDKLRIDNYVFLADGLIKLRVVKKAKDYAICRVINGGILHNHKGINVPGLKLRRDFLSEDDIEDIKLACKLDGDFLALSFVSCKEDILGVRALLKEYKREDMLIVSKIETSVGYSNIDEIIEHSDGIMVARGDLGIEMSLTTIPNIQKEIVKKCRSHNKFCIVATEMLLSMCNNSRPTRAEVTDVFNAVLDGTDAVMLSEETAVGKYPNETVKYMADICLEAEDKIAGSHLNEIDGITSAVAHSVVETANALDAKLIVASTLSGYTARLVSNLKPQCLVLATCVDEKVARKLAIEWGVYARVTKKFHTVDEVLTDATKQAKDFVNLKKKDVVVITGGLSHTNNTNIMKIEEI